MLGATQYKKNRTLCGGERTATDRGYGTDAPGWEVQERFVPITCEDCKALACEAALLASVFLLCPECIGTGMLNTGPTAPLWVQASAGAGGTFCMKCSSTGLVLAGHGGRHPLPGLP